MSGRRGSSRGARIAAFALLGLVLLALLYARNPYLLRNPQMWTEDLLVYFIDDLILTWRAILIPYNGTIQLVPRLVAFVGGLFPTALAPVIYSIASVCAVAGMVALTFVSTAFRGVGRWVAVLLIFLVPVGSEFFSAWPMFNGHSDRRLLWRFTSDHRAEHMRVRCYRPARSWRSPRRSVPWQLPLHL